MKLLAKMKLPHGIKDRLKCWLSIHFDLFKKYYDPNNYYLWTEMLKGKLTKDATKYVAFLKNDINALTVLNQVALIKKMLVK